MCGIDLQRVGRQLQRRRSPAVRSPGMIQVQFLDHLQCKQITLQDLDLGVQFGGIVVVEAEGGGVLEVQGRVRLVDRNAAVGLVNRRHL